MTARHSWSWGPRILTVMLLLTGCASEEKEEPSSPEPPGELVASDQQRARSPNVPAEDLAAVVAGNTDFGAALYRQSTRPGENLFFSPYSITQAFAMTYAGARGNTEAQMAQALRFVSQDRLHPALNALDLALEDRAAHPKQQGGSPPTLRAVNALWGQKGRTFEPAFLDTLAVNYGAGMRVVDFSTEAESIRSHINAWVKERTEDRIQGLLPEGSVQPDTRLVMANALYFKGALAVPFDESRTRSASFNRLDGSVQQVQMMAGADGLLPYGKGDGYEAVALPYSGQSFRMLLVIPDSGRFTQVESRLSASFLSEVRSKLETNRLFLRMPKFRVDTRLSLKEPLMALGLEDAFTDAADLSGMTTEEALRLTAAEHKAFVAVDEKGTEAAAATGVVVGPRSLPPELVVNRPFLFLIEDVDTQAVLFLGRIVNPSP